MKKLIAILGIGVSILSLSACHSRTEQSIERNVLLNHRAELNELSFPVPEKMKTIWNQDTLYYINVRLAEYADSSDRNMRLAYKYRDTIRNLPLARKYVDKAILYNCKGDSILIRYRIKELLHYRDLYYRQGHVLSTSNIK